MTSWTNRIEANPGRRRPAVQGRMADQDRTGKVKYSCSECEIFYYMPEGSKAHCPLCEQRQSTKQVRDALFQLTNAHHMLQNEAEGLRTQVDNLTAMKIALETISVEDLTFLKSVIYRWQQDHGRVGLKATHGAPKGRGRRRSSRPDGFIAIFRDSEPEVHQCNSIGGLALAGYLEEAQQLTSPIKAMETLVRAVLQFLQARHEA